MQEMWRDECNILKIKCGFKRRSNNETVANYTGKRVL